MQVIRNRSIVRERWRHELAGRDALASADIAPGDVIVSLDRWLADRRSLRSRGTRIGVRLAPDDDVDALVARGLHELALVEIEFTGVAEGRGYSQARLLRGRHGFRGVLRAVGDVSRDRLAFMERCGIDEFALPEPRSLADALAAFDELGVHYQPGADRAVTAALARGHRAHPGAGGRG